MESCFGAKLRRALLPAVLMLFLLEVLTLPLVLHYTYSGRSQAINHALTYTPGRLTWDSRTGIGFNGAARLDLFDFVYPDRFDPDVESADRDLVVAPGTEEDAIVRLKNEASGKITYTAVLYNIRTSPDLPVVADLAGRGFRDTERYPLPMGVRRNQVVRAVTGTLQGGAIQDFDISWAWAFYESDARDMVDTALGNKIPPDLVTVGLYIVVEDGNSYVTPDYSNPATGDTTPITMYTVLMAVSLLLLVLLIVDRRRRAAAEMAELAEMAETEEDTWEQ